MASGADDDVKAGLARIEGMLQATLPHHAARLDQHGQQLGLHDNRLRDVEQDVAVLKSGAASSTEVAVLEATGRLDREGSQQRKVVILQAATAIAGLLLVIVTVWAVFK